MGAGEGCEIRLSERDIGRKHTGLRVDIEGISVWITDLGGRGGWDSAREGQTPHALGMSPVGWGDEYRMGRKKSAF